MADSHLVPRRLAATVACVAALAPATAASAAAKPDLSVTKLSSPPASAFVGETFTAKGKVANDGERAAAGRVRLSLRRGPQPGPLGRRLGNQALDELAAGEAERFRVELTLPTDVEPGEYGIAACIRKRGDAGRRVCRSAPSRMAVGGPHQTEAGPGADGGPPEPPPPPDPGPVPTGFHPGARTAGDVLFPAIGNGGYDVQHYDVALDYDPVLNNFDSAATTITADATQNLSEFSLDLQGLTVSQVTVDGQPAEFSREATKLIVAPDDGIPAGEEFTAAVAYAGPPQEITDPDDSKEGWIHESGPTPDGGFVVNEPIGAQGWFPSNNHPSDKAAFDYHITVPMASTALGNGELVSNADNGDGTRTWHWSEDDPTATYLTTATVGNFIYSEGSVNETATGRTLPEYRAIDATYAATLPVINGELDRIEGMTNFIGDLYGPYPFDSTGAVVDSAPLIGYALEVQTKSHFSIPLTSASRSTLLHEIAHQWFGDDVSPAMWSDIWFNEGWAVWSEWFWGNQTGETTTTPEDEFQQNYDSRPEGDADWGIAPAVLDGDPANLFDTFPVYTRSAMTLQGYREIVGHAKFLELARRIQSERGGGNISTSQFIAMAKDVSGFTGAQLQRLDEYFQQWLYGEARPAITPDNF